VGDAASFIFVAGIVFQKRPAGHASPIGPKRRRYERRKDLETAKESIVALHLKLGFKVVVEWTSPKKYGPMCSFYGILARFDQRSPGFQPKKSSLLSVPAALGVCLDRPQVIGRMTDVTAGDR
jgi:hypothetical protein